MFLNVVDYHGNQVAIDPKRVIKMRAASLSEEPSGTVFVDDASHGTYVQGTLADIARRLGTYIRLGAFHAPDGQDIFVNKDGIASIGVDNRYAGNAVLIAGAEFENIRI